MRKIKTALDPAWAADGGYIGRKPVMAAKFLPIARVLVFRSRRLLGQVMVKSFKKVV